VFGRGKIPVQGGLPKRRFGRCKYNYYLIQIRGYYLFVLATACYLAREPGRSGHQRLNDAPAGWLLRYEHMVARRDGAWIRARPGHAFDYAIGRFNLEKPGRCLYHDTF